MSVHSCRPTPSHADTVPGATPPHAPSQRINSSSFDPLRGHLTNMRDAPGSKQGGSSRLGDAIGISITDLALRLRCAFVVGGGGREVLFGDLLLRIDEG